MTCNRVSSWALVAIHAVVGVAAPQLMLCFHQDGRSQIELATLRCCESPAQPRQEDCCGEPSSRPCPDDQCQDVPFTLVSSQVSLALPTLDLPALESSTVDLPEAAPGARAALEDVSPSGDPPPESGSKEFLRTVILRL